MGDAGQQQVSTLAIAEKRPQRPGGCVGIFFQLFDWNKRLAKKKLFSRKLLPHSRLKRAVKKFSKGDKLPGAKLRLIADENCGGFPKKVDSDGFSSSSSNAKHCKMQTPNLVARLMGLESMPVANCDKPSKNVLPSEVCDGLSKNFCQSSDFCYDEDGSPEKSQHKPGLRPQKLQRTGLFERAPVTKMGVEALQFKTVLARSRKKQMKLPSPVKSPRAFSRRKATRLMGAATRILEPSIEATNRAKRLLSYSAVPSSRIHGHCADDGATAPSTSSRGIGNRCNSCGHFVGDELNSNLEEQVPEYLSLSSDLSCSSGGSRFKPSFSPHENERKKERITLTDHAGAGMHTAQVEKNGRCQSRCTMDEGVHCDNDVGNSKRVLFENSFCKTKNNQKQNSTEASDELRSPRNCSRQIYRRELSPNQPSGTKDYIAMNRNLAGQSRSRLHEKVGENGKSCENTAVSKMNDTSLRANDRRPFHGTQPVDTNLIRARNGFNKCKRYAHATVKNDSQKKFNCGSHGGAGTKDNVSFFFNSSVRSNNRSGSSREIRDKAEDSCYRRVSTDAKNLSREAEEHGVHALGILLEKKLRELTHLETNGPETGIGLASKSTTAILEDLVSALSRQYPAIEKSYNLETSQGYDSPKSCTCRMHDQVCRFCDKQEGCLRKRWPSSTSSLAFDCDNPSPTSIFEACFSNDSNCSHSLDSGSGKNQQFSPSFQEHGRQRPRPETEVLDSANSRQLWVCGNKNSESLKKRVGTIQYVDDHAGSLGSSEDRLNVDMLFGKENFVADPSFMSKMHALSEVMEAKNACGAFSDSDAMAGNCKRLFVEFMIEYIITRPSYLPHKWCWSKLPLVLSKQQLTMEAYREISKCLNLAGMLPDEIVEWELINYAGNWEKDDLETIEMSTNIAGLVFQILLDELVVDL